MIMAVFANMMMFGATSGPKNFVCVEYKAYDRDTNLEDILKLEPDSACYSLNVFDTSYWIGNEFQDGWAGALKAGAVFGAIATSLGVVSIAYLLKTTCFEIQPREVSAKL